MVNTLKVAWNTHSYWHWY